MLFSATHTQPPKHLTINQPSFQPHLISTQTIHHFLNLFTQNLKNSAQHLPMLDRKKIKKIFWIFLVSFYSSLFVCFVSHHQLLIRNFKSDILNKKRQKFPQLLFTKIYRSRSPYQRRGGGGGGGRSYSRSRSRSR